MGSKTTPAGVTTSTGTTAPWAPQQPYLENALSSASSLFENTTGPQYYPGQTYAPETFGENQGINALYTAGNDVMNSGSLAATNNFAQDLANGQYLKNNPGSKDLQSLTGSGAGLSDAATAGLNPYASGAYVNGGAANPYTNALTQNIMSSVVPSIQSQFINGGDLASPSAAFATTQGVTNALAPSLFSNYQTQENLQQQAANTLQSGTLASGGLRAQAGQGVGNLYNSGVQSMMGGEAMEPGLLQAQLLGPQAEFASGQQGQALNQNAINDAVQRWNYNQTLPYQNLNEYIGQVSGNYGGTSSISNPYYLNQGANAASGALGGAMLGNTLAGGTAAAPSGMGKIIGSLLGGGAAIASDRRLKRDITRFGEIGNGLAVYRFRYHDDPEWRIGLMADEVEHVHPEAVFVGPFGFKMVDYAQAVM